MNESESRLLPLLDPGERLLWSGQPKQGVRLQANDIFLIPFSLMWGGFALFWEAMALGAAMGWHHVKPSGKEPPEFMIWLFPLWGVPFVLIGLYMIFGRFFFDAAQRQKTYYGVTEQRLMILKTLFFTKVTSYDLATFTNLSVVEKGDRSGDILFGSPVNGNGYGNPFATMNRRSFVPGFYLLPQVRDVYNRIRQAQQAAK